MKNITWISRLKWNLEEKKKRKLIKQFEFLAEEYRIGQQYIISEIKKNQEATASSSILFLEHKLCDSKNEIESSIKKILKRIDDISNENYENHKCIIDSINNVADIHDEKLKNATERIDTELKHRFSLINNCINQFQDKSQNNYIDAKKYFQSINIQLEGVNSDIIKSNEFIEKNCNKLNSDNNERLKRTVETIDSTMNKRFSTVENLVNQTYEKLDNKNNDIRKVLQNINSQLELLQNRVKDNSVEANKIIGERTNEIVLSIDEIQTLIKVIAVNNLLEEI